MNSRFMFLSTVIFLTAATNCIPACASITEKSDPAEILQALVGGAHSLSLNENLHIGWNRKNIRAIECTEVTEGKEARKKYEQNLLEKTADHTIRMIRSVFIHVRSNQFKYTFPTEDEIKAALDNSNSIHTFEDYQTVRELSSQTGFKRSDTDQKEQIIPTIINGLKNSNHQSTQAEEKLTADQKQVLLEMFLSVGQLHQNDIRKFFILNK